MKKAVTKLVDILSNQKELRDLLRQQRTSQQGGSADHVGQFEDVVPQPLNSKDELDELDDKLQQEPEFRKKMVSFGISACCLYWGNMY